MINVVFDTMIFVRALINPFGSCGGLLFQHRESYELFLSPLLSDEIRDVISRPELARKFRRVTPSIMAEFNRLLGTARMVQTPEMVAISRDPRDDKVLALAQAADAAYLVTDDQDLLVLRSHGEASIVTPVTFLLLLLDNEEESQ